MLSINIQIQRVNTIPFQVTRRRMLFRTATTLADPNAQRTPDTLPALLESHLLHLHEYACSWPSPCFSYSAPATVFPGNTRFPDAPPFRPGWRPPFVERFEHFLPAVFATPPHAVGPMVRRHHARGSSRPRFLRAMPPPAPRPDARVRHEASLQHPPLPDKATHFVHAAVRARGPTLRKSHSADRKRQAAWIKSPPLRAPCAAPSQRRPPAEPPARCDLPAPGRVQAVRCAVSAA